MKLVNFRRLKIGRRSRAREREEIEIFINHHQLIKIKFTLDKIWNLPKRRYWNCSVTGDGLAACSATKHDLDDRESIPADQGAAVAPADVTVHEEIRPETHWLVRTEVSRLIRVG